MAEKEVLKSYSELLAQGVNLNSAKKLLIEAFEMECNYAVDLAKYEAQYQHEGSSSNQDDFDAEYEKYNFLANFQKQFPLDYREIADPPADLNHKTGWNEVESSANSLTELWLRVRKLKEEASESSSSESLEVLSWLIESARTTSLAIALLVREGFLADAQARWRGLYEQTCQLAILAKSTDFNIHQACQNFGESQNSEETAAKSNYAWVKSTGIPNLPQGRMRQKDILDQAKLTIPNVPYLMRHEAVHMSNLVVKRGGTPAGLSRSGASQEGLQEISVATLVTLVDLVANTSLFVSKVGVENVQVLAFSHDFFFKVTDFIRTFNDVAEEFLEKCRVA